MMRPKPQIAQTSSSDHFDMTFPSPPVVTRFAPSPTGFLHIGGARTALFNWLFARHHNGKFLLRIEDTDQKRSTKEAIDAILDGMQWLGLDWDGDAIYQSERQDRHSKAVEDLLAEGKAYRCYTTAEELAAMREEAQQKGERFSYPHIWRDRDPSEAPEGVKPSIRLKAPLEGETVIHDAVQGTVRVPNADLDDMILMRADGTPTYMLAVVVDDHEMNVTHIIRGDDHLTNTFRQQLLYDALGWKAPTFAHIPLIHGPDGAKLSKRHGALGIEAYRELGYLPEALRNYLLRLGWAHGDDELITTQQAIEWFGMEGIGKSPSRMDFDKMAFINNHYLRQMDNAELIEQLAPFYDQQLGRTPDATTRARLLHGLTSLKSRANTLVELAELSSFYLMERPLNHSEQAQKALDSEAVERLATIADTLETVERWEEDALDGAIKAFVEEHSVPFKKVGMPVRAALTGTVKAPGIGELLTAFGKEESLTRLRNAGEQAQQAA